MDQKTVDELLTKTEQRWREVLVARRKAVEVEETYREALQKWYEEQVEGGTNATATPDAPSG